MRSANKRHDKFFNFRRYFSLFIAITVYMMVSFQKGWVPILKSDMAKDYHVDQERLTVLSSIFFYPYACDQPFAGLLSDIIEPAFLIGVMNFIAGFGTVLTGLSKSIYLGEFGRFLSGLGSGPTFVPISKFVANWFTYEQYPIVIGFISSFSGVGLMLAQGPLYKLNEHLHWRSCLYLFGGVAMFFSLLCLFFVRGNPVSLGYQAVNDDFQYVEETWTIKERFKQLGKNFITVIINRDYWLHSLYVITLNGPYFSFCGNWANEYFSKYLEVHSKILSRALVVTAIGYTLGCLTLPPLSNALKTRKKVIVALSIVLTIDSIIILKFGKSVNIYLLYFLLFMYGYFNCGTSVSFTLVRESYHPHISGSAVGCVNFHSVLFSGIYQSISLSIINLFNRTNDSYNIAVWFVASISSCIALVSTLLMRDTKIFQEKPKYYINSESLSTQASGSK